MTGALSEECHVLGICILDLEDEISIEKDRLEDKLDTVATTSASVAGSTTAEKVGAFHVAVSRQQRIA